MAISVVVARVSQGNIPIGFIQNVYQVAGFQ